MGLRQAELAAHDVGSLYQRDHLVEGMAPAHALATHSAVGAQDQAVGWDVPERTADVIGDLLGPFDLQTVMVNHADGDLLVGGDLLAEGLQVHAAGAAGFEGDHIGIDPVDRRQRRLVALHLREHALLGWVAPAGVAPHLGLRPQPSDRSVEDLDAEGWVDHLVDDVAYCEQVDLWLLELNGRTAGIGKLVQLLVQGVGDGKDAILHAGIVPVGNGEGDQLGPDGAELDRLVGHTPSSLPHRGILQVAAADRPNDAGHYSGFQIVVQDVARREREAAFASQRWARIVVIEALHVARWIVGPALAAHVLVEVGIAVGDDIETRAFLLVQIDRDRVRILLAIGRADHRLQEGAPAEVLHVPARARERPG